MGVAGSSRRKLNLVKYHQFVLIFKNSIKDHMQYRYVTPFDLQPPCLKKTRCS